MRRFTEVLGQPVVSASSADKVGTVSALVVDPAGGRLAALRVKGPEADFVGWDDLRGIGPDAVVISSTDALRLARTPMEERARDGDVDLIGKRVLTDAGAELGTLADVEFDPETGLLETVIVGERRLPGGGIRGVGPYAVVVRDADVDEPPTAAPL